jgi:hypothetical protein
MNLGQIRIFSQALLVMHRLKWAKNLKISFMARSTQTLFQLVPDLATLALELHKSNKINIKNRQVLYVPVLLSKKFSVGRMSGQRSYFAVSFFCIH